MVSVAPSRYVLHTATRPSGSTKYIRAAYVAVLDTASGPGSWHWVRNGVVWSAGRKTRYKLDSRYTGPRSAFGQAMESGRQMLARLNAEAAAALPDFAGEGI